MGERRVAYEILVGKHEGKRPLGIPRRRWKDINKYSLGQDRDKERALATCFSRRTLLQGSQHALLRRT
jgi:hypothetical protein